MSGIKIVLIDLIELLPHPHIMPVWITPDEQDRKSLVVELSPQEAAQSSGLHIQQDMCSTWLLKEDRLGQAVSHHDTHRTWQ